MPNERALLFRKQNKNKIIFFCTAKYVYTCFSFMGNQLRKIQKNQEVQDSDIRATFSLPTTTICKLTLVKVLDNSGFCYSNLKRPLSESHL